MGGISPLYTHCQLVKSCMSAGHFHFHVSLWRVPWSLAITVCLWFYLLLPYSESCLREKVPMVTSFFFTEVCLFTLYAVFSSQYRFFLVLGDQLPSFPSSSCCCIPLSGCNSPRGSKRLQEASACCSAILGSLLYFYVS